MNTEEIRQLRASLEGLPNLSVVEIGVDQLHDLLDLAEREAKRREDRTVRLRPLKDK